MLKKTSQGGWAKSFRAGHRKLCDARPCLWPALLWKARGMRRYFPRPRHRFRLVLQNRDDGFDWTAIRLTAILKTWAQNLLSSSMRLASLPRCKLHLRWRLHWIGTGQAVTCLVKSFWWMVSYSKRSKINLEVPLTYFHARSAMHLLNFSPTCFWVAIPGKLQTFMPWPKQLTR